MKNLIRLTGATSIDAARAAIRSSKRARSDRTRSFRASTNALDRHGTIINPMGIKTEKFDANPVVVYGHDAYGSALGGTPSIDNILGKVVGHRKTASSFDVDIQFATAEENARADTALRLVDGGYLSAVSIGFIPISTREEKRNGKMTPILDEVELLEVSLVPVPSNPEAVAIVRSMLGGSRIARPATLGNRGGNHLAACVRSAFRDAKRELASSPRERVLRRKIAKIEQRTRALEHAKLDRMAEVIGRRIVEDCTRKLTLSTSLAANRLSENLRGVRQP